MLYMALLCNKSGWLLLIKWILCHGNERWPYRTRESYFIQKLKNWTKKMSYARICTQTQQKITIAHALLSYADRNLGYRKYHYCVFFHFSLFFFHLWVRVVAFTFKIELFLRLFWICWQWKRRMDADALQCDTIDHIWYSRVNISIA